MGKFVHLHTHSHYSLLDGLGKIPALIQRAKELNMDALAITDHGNLYGAVEFYKEAKKAGIKPIFGVEGYMAPGSRLEKDGRSEKYFHLILLAKNEQGWKNLLKLSTRAALEGYYYKPRMDKELLRELHDGLIALSGCITGEVARLLLANKYDDAKRVALEYEELFGKSNYYIEIGHHPGIPEVERVNPLLKKLARETGIPLAATQDIHYVRREDAEYHDILLAVQTGNKLTDPDRLTLKDDDFAMSSPEDMAAWFADCPDAVENTVRIAEMCAVDLPLGKLHLPRFAVPDGMTADDYMDRLIAERLPGRYPDGGEAVDQRVAYETGVIKKMGFADYFLIVQDFIQWAKSHGVIVGPGRGSAAGSIVSYILGITDIDPLKYDLLFERFLNPERIQMPDIDIDFADKRRDEVLAYVSQKYGEDHVAQIITFGTMAARAAIRDVGRALGVEYGVCDAAAKLVPFATGVKKALEKVTELRALYDSGPDVKRVVDAAIHLEGVARHASVHACGVVISEEPLVEYLPLQHAPGRDDKTVITQFEMHAVEDMGLLKMDFLGLKNLTIIEETVRLIRDLRGEDIDMSAIPLDDPATFPVFAAGDTTGVFQFESSGMRRYLKELKPTEFEDIVAMVALYRPGPMELIPQYINRKHGREEVTYLHERLRPILETTYGIGIYQEQMMRIARDVAGYTLPEADTLRKAIGKKIRSLLDEQQIKLVSGMTKNGIPERTAKAIWELFPPFARYGFNRSHAACYALIAYRTAYLRAHYPLEFMTGLYNADADDVDRIAFLVAEAKKLNIQTLPPDVNASMVQFVPHEGAIRFGLLAIKNLGAHVVDTIVEERARGGPFAGMEDFLSRIMDKDMNKKSLEALIKSGAFDSFGVERNALLTNMEALLKFSAVARKTRDEAHNSLFGGSTRLGTLTLASAPPASAKEKLAWEKELLGLFISSHPLTGALDRIREARARPIKELLEQNSAQGNVCIAGTCSRIKKITTKTGMPMLFARLQDLSGEMEVVVFTNALNGNSAVWKEHAALLVRGRTDLRNGSVNLICESAEEL
ncbi:MAG: DNA polymerase III subunit alpha [Candidatus Liptonbacteria bacterium]|nr:DNA polymerase III subunit alpha [Candidatus Liptonbacteria bacterium]